MENTNVKLEQKESSATWASEKGSCTEVPARATEQKPAEQRMSETPLTGEEHSSSCSQTMESLEGLAEKVSTLSLQVTKKNRCGAARKRARKARLAEAPTGATDGGQPQSATGKQPLDSQKPGTSGAQHRWDLQHQRRSPRRVEGTHMVQANDSGRLGALRRAGRLRGPSRLGRLAMPELLQGHLCRYSASDRSACG
jgi:hypothetical protein